MEDTILIWYYLHCFFICVLPFHCRHWTWGRSWYMLNPRYSGSWNIQACLS